MSVCKRTVKASVGLKKKDVKNVFQNKEWRKHKAQSVNANHVRQRRT
jgi:hypothetical protein